MPQHVRDPSPVSLRDLAGGIAARAADGDARAAASGPAAWRDRLEAAVGGQARDADRGALDAATDARLAPLPDGATDPATLAAGVAGDVVAIGLLGLRGGEAEAVAAALARCGTRAVGHAGVIAGWRASRSVQAVVAALVARRGREIAVRRAPDDAVARLLAGRPGRARAHGAARDVSRALVAVHAASTGGLAAALARLALRPDLQDRIAAGGPAGDAAARATLAAGHAAPRGPKAPLAALAHAPAAVALARIVGAVRLVPRGAGIAALPRDQSRPR